MLLVSQGVPMLLMGDELGRTKQGNNNTYCHDNQLNWLNWTLVERNADLFRFFKHMIAFRKEHPVLRNRWHLSNRDYVGSGYADITWHGVQAWDADWSGFSRILAFMLCGKHAHGGRVEDSYIYVAMNMHWEGHEFGLPALPEGLHWHVFANTGAETPDDIYAPGSEPRLADQDRIWIGDRSVLILVGK